MRDINLRSRKKLKPVDAKRFAHCESSLFVDLATVVCSTGVLPQKELHECWQMAACVHREFPASLRVADLAAGHGLLAWILVLLARSGERAILRTAVAVDVTRPKSADILAAAITARWPELAETVHYVEGSIDAVTAEAGSATLFVAAHACGRLSDRVLLAAVASRCPLAIMPCCHSLRKQTQSLASLALASGLSAASVVGRPASIDRFRIEALSALGYEVTEASIEPEVTPFNRIIMGKPRSLTARALLPAQSALSSEPGARRIGQVRAYEKVRSLDLGDLDEARALSKAPSREWLRAFDLSCWVEDAAMGRRLALELASSTPDEAFERRVSIRDQYVEPGTQRVAFTYRIEMRSATGEITKANATALRNELCRALAESHHRHCRMRC